ncbi:MAG: pyruvate ferredoxin oxidoreductase, partial [Candidatus Aenigmatarchaeota archaeon]
YGLLEEYKLDDADTVFISTGSLSTTVKQTIDELRKEGKKPGLLRIRTFRPFPEKEIRTALADKDKIGVLDNDVAPGFGGIIYSEVRSALYGTDKRISNYILSLGGRHVGVKDFKAIHKKIEKGSEKRYWLGL